MKKPEDLRSFRWFGGERTAGLRAFGHRSRMRQLGVEPEEHLGKPLIAILNTWSELNPCHMHLRQRAEQVKRGVLEAGGFPVEMPVATLSETFQKPTPMMYRNLLAMETEELRLADSSADNVSVVKEAMAQLGLCRADVRPPSRPLPENIKDEIRGILREWDLA